MQNRAWPNNGDNKIWSLDKVVSLLLFLHLVDGRAVEHHLLPALVVHRVATEVALPVAGVEQAPDEVATQVAPGRVLGREHAPVVASALVAGGCVADARERPHLHLLHLVRAVGEGAEKRRNAGEIVKCGGFFVGHD